MLFFTAFNTEMLPAMEILTKRQLVLTLNLNLFQGLNNGSSNQKIKTITI